MEETRKIFFGVPRFYGHARYELISVGAKSSCPDEENWLLSLSSEGEWERCDRSQRGSFPVVVRRVGGFTCPYGAMGHGLSLTAAMSVAGY